MAHTQPDARKAFAAIAMIMTARANGTKVTLAAVRKRKDDERKAS